MQRRKRMAEEWEGFITAVLPGGAPGDQLIEMHRAFMAGARSIFDLMIRESSPGGEPTESDMEMMQALSDELDEWLAVIGTPAERATGGYPFDVTEALIRLVYLWTRDAGYDIVHVGNDLNEANNVLRRLHWRGIYSDQARRAAAEALVRHAISNPDQPAGVAQWR